MTEHFEVVDFFVDFLDEVFLLEVCFFVDVVCGFEVVLVVFLWVELGSEVECFTEVEGLPYPGGEGWV